MEDKLKKLILLMEIKNEEKFSDFSKSIEQLDKQDIELSNDIDLLYKELSKIEGDIKSFDVSEQIKELKSDIENIQLQKGDKGEDGKDGSNGKDGRNGRNGIDGINGIDGKDGENGKDGSPDTAGQIVEKINTLENVIDIKTIKDFPKIEGNADIKRQVDTIGNQVLRLMSKQTQSVDLSGYVPNTRTLTINGTALDLSADRSWSVGTVTDVAALTLGTTGTDLSSSVATGTTTPIITLNVPTASALNRGALSSTDWSTFNSKESVLTFSTGLTRSTNTITNNLSTGISGGQSVIGGTASGNNLTLSSTTNATKGKILFGTSAYDEVNNRLGIGTTTPAAAIEAAGSIRGNAFGFAVKLVPDSTGSRIQFGITATADNSMMEIGSYNAKNNIDTKGRDLQIFSTTATTGLTFKQATGFIGINTTNPGSMLEVIGLSEDTLRLGNVANSVVYKIGRSNGSGFLKFQGTQSGYSGYDFRTSDGTGAVVIQDDRNTAFGGLAVVSAATAKVHIMSGTATAGTAPLKFRSGTNLTTPEAGAMEYNGSSLFFTRSGTLRAGLLMTDTASPFNTYSQSAKGATAFTSGTDNFLGGQLAGGALTGGSQNVMIGTQAGNFSNSGLLNSVMIGYFAGQSASGLTTGAIFIGSQAGQNSAGATNSIFIGQLSGFNSIATNATFIGNNAGNGATNALDTIGLGQNAGRNATGSIESIYLGTNTGYNATGSGITGDYNIAIGSTSARALTTGSKNVLIGYNLEAQSNTADGQLTIQNAIFGTDNTGTGKTASTGKIGIFAPAPNSSLQVTGSMSNSYVAKTANYTLTDQDYTVDCTANSFTVTLPTAVGVTGRVYVIKNTGTATIITMATTSSQTIDGTTPPTITTLTPLRVQSNGANWITI